MFHISPSKTGIDKRPTVHRYVSQYIRCLPDRDGNASFPSAICRIFLLSESCCEGWCREGGFAGPLKYKLHLLDPTNAVSVAEVDGISIDAVS